MIDDPNEAKDEQKSKPLQYNGVASNFEKFVDK
jgi:hypothetical protein